MFDADEHAVFQLNGQRPRLRYVKSLYSRGQWDFTSHTARPGSIATHVPSGTEIVAFRRVNGRFLIETLGGHYLGWVNADDIRE